MSDPDIQEIPQPSPSQLPSTSYSELPSTSSSELPSTSSSKLTKTSSKDGPESSNISRRTRSKALGQKEVRKATPELTSSLTNIIWTDVEKLNLIDALNTYGSESKRTYNCLKTKSDNQIRQFLRTRQRIARIKKQKRINESACEKQRKGKQGTKDCVTPLEEWIQYFLQRVRNDASDKPKISPHLVYQLLPTAFLILSLFEAHPDPQDCGGVNFKEVYEFLYTILRGNPTKWLQKPTANFLFTAFYDACKCYRETAVKDESYFLNIVSNCAKETAEESAPEKPQKIRTYPGKRKQQPTEVKLEKSRVPRQVPEYVSKLLRTECINPFRMPVEYLEFPTDKTKE